MEDTLEVPRLISTQEAWLDTEDGKLEFAFVKIIWQKDGNFYFTKHSSPSAQDCPVDDLFVGATLIPREYYTTDPLPQLTRATRPPDAPEFYVKKPHGNGGNTAAQNLAHEAQICNVLMKHPHPNICNYYGYIASHTDGRMEALLFDRHGSDLRKTVRDKLEVNVDVVVAGISAGIQHLHSLGYVHNDINPSNVVLRPSIGTSGKKMGTTGWTNNAPVSKPENDWYGLEKVKQWLAEKAKQTDGTSYKYRPHGDCGDSTCSTSSKNPNNTYYWPKTVQKAGGNNNGGSNNSGGTSGGTAAQGK
ncbi:hypothetical protein R3P38DRAFT_3260804 [Favolaschia claudopus]|uniref:Protein kinase domain-containing protein n=1 Tax=Favolaschia claudopus TaxID=2862362 RepID=A0AAW0CPI5_9AGAR